MPDGRLAGGGQRGLVASQKRAIPPHHPARVARPGLVARLDQSDFRVGTVVAPAGYGKTTVLAEWARRAPERTAWLSCDERDRDPYRFWSAMVATVSARWPGVGDDAAILLERDASDRDVAVSVANDLREVDGPVAVIVDDIDFASPQREALSTFVDALPPPARLVVGSRRDAPLPLARLRVSGSLLELRSRDLRFSADEAAGLFELARISLDTDDLRRVHELTEGWPAGLQLTALALARSTDIARSIAAFGSTDRALSDYLINEVLEHQPPELVEFMTMTSVLEEFDAALCNTVTGRDDSSTCLDALASADLFLVQLEERGEWYRYHHLFGAFLLARLKSLGEQRLGEAHRRAMEALESRGDVLGALRHATTVGDMDRAATIVTTALARRVATPDTRLTEMAVRAWLDTYGHDSVKTDPDLVLWFLAALSQWAAHSTEKWLIALDEAHTDGPPPLRAVSSAVWAEYHLARGDADEGVARMRTAYQAVGGEPPTDGLGVLFPVVRVRAHLQAGDLLAADAALDAVTRPTGHPVVDRVRLPSLRAWVAFESGELLRASHLADGVLESVEELSLGSSDVGSIMATVTRAGLCLEHGDAAQAAGLLNRAQAAAEAARRPPLQSLVAVQQAQLANALADETAAKTHLTHARLVFTAPSPAVRAALALEVARSAIRFNPDEASGLLDRLSDSPASQLLRARLAVAHRDRAAAISMLGELADHGTLRQRVEAGILTALALLGRDIDASTAILRDALRLARPEGFARTILDFGPDVPQLLASLPSHPQLDGYVQALLDAADNDARRDTLPFVSPLAEPLSAREITVLRYFSSRLTNHELAAALFISVNTLRTHAKAVYRKLNVSSRAEAVQAGRALGII